MMIALTTSQIPTQQATGGTRTESQAVETSAAFEELLELTRLLAAGGSGNAGPLPEAQMFEAADRQDGHNAAARREREDAAAQRFEDPAGDRTSVRARRAAAEETMSRSDRARQTEGTATRERSLLRGLDRPDPTARVADQSPQDSRREVGRLDESRLRMTNVPAATRSVQTTGQATTEPATSAPTASTAAAGASTIPNGSGSTEAVARQVGQILGVTRGGEVESPRAVSSPAAAHAATDRSTGQSATGRGIDRPGSETRPHSDGSADGGGYGPRGVRSPREEHQAEHGYADIVGPHAARSPELGRMFVDVKLHGSRVEIQVRTESAHARELLYERIESLRAALEQHGVRIDRFDVTTDLARDGEAMAGEGQESPLGSLGDEDPSHQAGRERSDGQVEPDAAAELPAGVESTESDDEADAEARLDVRV